MRSRGAQIVKNIDWGLALLYLTLVIMGWMTIYAAGFSEEHPSIFDGSQEYGKQFIWILTALILASLVLMLETTFIANSAYVFYGIMVLMLIAVLFTTPINGAKSWFGFGGFGIQPSEFAKIATALVVAKFLSTSGIKTNDPMTRVKIIGLIALPASLILLQPDPGTLLVFLSFVLVMYREGLSGNILLFGVFQAVLAIMSIFLTDFLISFSGLGFEFGGQGILTSIIITVSLLAGFLIKKMARRKAKKKSYAILLFASLASLVTINGTKWAFDNVLEDRHQNRIHVLLGMLEDKTGVGYNTHQAMTAIGSGGFTGKGYLQGTLSNHKFSHVPEQSTDFIFCPLGEEWGFLGGILVIGIFLALLVKIIFVAERQRSQFTRIYAYCVAGIIFFHLMINIGMAIGIAPVIGIPLPFFSYGGSSLLSFTILIFVLIKLDSDRFLNFR